MPLKILRRAVAAAVALCGLALVVGLAVNAAPGTSVFDYTKTVVAALVTIRLLLWLRPSQDEPADSASAASDARRTKKIALGLVIGLVAPVLLVGLIVMASR